MKLLSVIVPLYNSAQWVEKCLTSVLNQDIPEEQMEIICVNDGSPDHSAEIVREIGKEHPSITVIDQENQGPSGARNNGMRHATGKYLMFVDPDDYVDPNTFGGLVQQMEEEQLDMLRFNFRRVDEFDNELPVFPEDAIFDYSAKRMSGSEFIADRLGIGCNIWRYVYRMNIITENNIWCFTGDYYDDTPWLPLVLQKCKSITCVDKIVYNYLDRQDGLVRASSLDANRRKIDGQFLLLSYLLEEKKNVNDMGVIKWYDNMMAHCTMCVLTMTALYQFEFRKNHIIRLEELNQFPLKAFRTSIKSLRKIKWINFSPLLFVWICHLKNLIFK